jgi:hypothetical protein
MRTQVARPTSALGTGIFAGNGLSAKFAMKVFEYSGQHTVPVQEVTGTGDSSAGGPVYEHGDLAYSTFRLTGCMLAGGALGLTNLNNQISSGGASVTLELSLSGNNQGTKKVVIESIQVQASMRQSAVVGVVISGRYVEDALSG